MIVWEDWSALRRRTAGQALARLLAFSGWRAGTVERDAPAGACPAGAILLHTPNGVRQLEVGPVQLLWGGSPLTGAPPDWPRSLAPEAACFFLTARPLAEAVTLDFDLAARRDAGNPYYFICYTRRRLGALSTRRGPDGSDALRFSAEGRDLALALDRFPAAVRRACALCDPWPVNRCALALAEAAQGFLRARGEDRPLLAAAESTLGNALGLLMGSGVPCTSTAPQDTARDTTAR